MTRLPQAIHLLTSAFRKNVLYSICIGKMHFFSVLSNKGAMQLPGDDARFCICRIVVASPLLLTTRYGFPPYVCEGIVVLEQYELRRIPNMFENEFTPPLSIYSVPPHSLFDVF